jgi:hypothetical protein
MPQDDPIAGLARQIDTARKREIAKTAGQTLEFQRHGACELHSICARFASSVNSRLSDAALSLSPPVYTGEMFRDSGVNLFQIGAGGREIQIVFQATRDRVSTEKYLIPYVLEGEVRAFNQKMLERFEIRNQLLFFCLEDGNASWRFFDWRTRHTGPFGEDLLLTLMQGLFA